eukprot:3862500-Pyramimonas_sp.AAC.1
MHQGQPQQQARNDPEDDEDVGDREPAQVGGHATQRPGHGERHGAHGRDREPDERSDEVEEQVRKRHRHAGRDVRARQRRQHARDGGAHVRADGEREHLVELDEPDSDERRQRRGCYAAALHEDGDAHTEEDEDVVGHKGHRLELQVQQPLHPNRGAAPED